MTNSDSRSLSEAGSLAKQARLLEDKICSSVCTTQWDGNTDEFQSQGLPAYVCLQFYMVLIVHFSIYSPIHVHTAQMKRPTLSGVVSVVIPLSAVWEAVPSLLADLHNEFKWSWSLQCCSPPCFSVGKRSISTGTMQCQYCKPRWLSLVLFLFTFQRFCFSKALQHGGRRKALLFRWQLGTQCRTCPAAGAAQLFLPSAKTFNVWIIAETQKCSGSCSLSQLISLLEGEKVILDNLFPG